MEILPKQGGTRWHSAELVERVGGKGEGGRPRDMDHKTTGDLACEVKCKRLACAIQKCLSRRRPSSATSQLYQDQCSREIRLHRECCETAKREAASSTARQ